MGTSGWSYDHWLGALYPPGSAAADRLGHYVRRFETVELNSSFYRWPRTESFARWREQLPAGFQLSVKAPRGLTHAKKLYAPEVWVDRIAACFHELGDRRGALLVQLAPQHARDDARLDYFLGRLPPWIRVSVELRHLSWQTDDVFALLEHHGAAYCVMSGANLACILRATGPFVYVRLHGPDDQHLYGGRIRTRTCAGGRRGCTSGTAAAGTCTPTSTTTARRTRSATRTRCAASWVSDSRPGAPRRVGRRPSRTHRPPPRTAGRRAHRVAYLALVDR